MNPAEIERFLGHCLAASIGEGASTDRALSVLRTGRVPWERVAESSNRALVTPALRGFLCGAAVAHLVPAVVRHHVDGAYHVSEQRNRAMWRETLEVIGLLNGIGVNPLLLKGAANLAAGLYPGRGSRMMCDSDLLVPAHLLAACADTLLDAGYTGSRLSRDDHHHYPALHRSGQTAYFELHREPVAARNGGQALLNSAEMHARATLCSEAAVTFAIPPAELRIVHAVVHDMLANQGFPRGKRSLRDMYDVLLLCTRHAAEVSWDRLSERFEEHGRRQVIAAYTLALEDVMGWRPPARLSRWSTRARLAHWKWLLQRRIPPLNRAVLWLHRIGARGLVSPRRWASFVSRRFPAVFR